MKRLLLATALAVAFVPAAHAETPMRELVEEAL